MGLVRAAVDRSQVATGRPKTRILAAGKLIGIVSEGDFIRRAEIGTQRKRGRFVFALATRHNAELAAKPQGCPGYRGAHYGNEKVVAKI